MVEVTKQQRTQLVKTFLEAYQNLHTATMAEQQARIRYDKAFHELLDQAGDLKNGGLGTAQAWIDEYNAPPEAYAVEADREA